MSGQRSDTHDMMGGIWSINGVGATGHVMEPLLTLRRGEPYVLALRNDTAWAHPIHLHGHSFRVIARNGTPTRFREWQERSEEHKYKLQTLMRNSYDVFCLNKKKDHNKYR